ncbi:MFS transporter [Kutzneria sp. NPDC052558]|uniref:MFS transporter n=1 Tax=Kutzneria sp. NPDC052558 TaxID=3364121 RepID=UPI0037C5C356
MDPAVAVSQRNLALASRPFWLTAVALLWPAQLVNMSQAIATVAQAQVAQTFHTTQIVWFNVVYALIGTLLLPFAVKLSDMVGKRKVMLALVLIGLVGDIMCALATSYDVLLVGRAVAAFYVPVAALALAAARDVVPAAKLPGITGAIGAALGGVVAVGPLIAGWLLDGFAFHGAMWFIATCTVIGLVLIVTVLPETPRHADRGGFDWAGGVLLGLGVLAVMSGIGRGSDLGWASGQVLGPVAIGLLVLVGFVFVERRARNPILNLSMLSRRKVATVLTASSLIQGTALAALGVMTVVIPLYPSIPGVSDGLGWTAVHGALVNLPAGIVMFVIGSLAAYGSRRFGSRTIWLAAVPVMIVGLVLQAFFHRDATQIISTGVLAALGAGIVFGCTPILVVESVSTKEQAQASGMSLMILGLVATFAAQITFTVLNASSTVSQGTAFYHEDGYRNAYLALALIVAIGFALSFVMPRKETRSE